MKEQRLVNPRSEAILCIGFPVSASKITAEENRHLSCISANVVPSPDSLRCRVRTLCLSSLDVARRLVGPLENREMMMSATFFEVGSNAKD